MDLSSLGWPRKTFIRSGHRTDRFDARKNENYLEWRDNGHLQAEDQYFSMILLRAILQYR